MVYYKGRFKGIIPLSVFKVYRLDQKRMIEYQILVFCDASKYAYGAAVYLRQEKEDSCRVDLIFSKARLVPNKRYLSQDLYY